MEGASKTAATIDLSKGLLQSKELYDRSVYPHEPEPLKELRAITSSHPGALMGTAPDAGQLMALLLELVNAKKTIEIGVYTGYSLLLTALTIPDDGQITAIDFDRSTYDIGLTVMKKAGVDRKINFIESEALPALDKLLEEPVNEGSYDYAFVDADKTNYWNYHERILKLLKPAGIVVYDNTLWLGTLIFPEEYVPELHLPSRNALKKFNELLASDCRVKISHVPAGDGLTICKRL